MELILAYAGGAEIRTLPWNADIEAGGTNTFEIEVPRTAWNADAGFWQRAYVPGTEFGGMIGEIATETEPRAVYLRGDTWRGMLDKKIISPEKGNNYYTISGSTSACIAKLLRDFFNDPLIRAESISRGTIRSFRFPRYCTLLDGLNRMLATINMKPVMRYVQEGKSGAVEVGCRPINNYEIVGSTGYGDEIDVRSDVRKNGINHLICLGAGELAARTVVHIYTNANGTVTSSQILKGKYENAAVFDFNGAQDAAELRKAGLDYLADLKSSTTIETQTNYLKTEREIGDMIRATDPITGANEWRRIERKILTITGGVPRIEYKLEGEA